MFDKTGKHTEPLEIKEDVSQFLKYQESVLRYVRTFNSNQRQGTQSTKTRAQVSGGGKKPFKQKGTGRARTGSTRNPIWVHGGVSHGPTPRNWRLTATKSLRTQALLCSFATKLLENNVKVLEDFEIKKPSTSDIVSILKKLKVTGAAVFVVNEANIILKKSIMNLPNVSYATAQNLNAVDIVSNKNIVMDKNSLDSLLQKAKDLS